MRERAARGRERAPGSFFATFNRELSGRATADLWLTLYSNSPTLKCVATSSLLGCPDVEPQMQ